MSATHYIGVDPGPIPGFVMLWPRTPRAVDIDVVQCSAKTATTVLWGLLNRNRRLLDRTPCVVQIEAFVIGRGSMRSAGAGAQTRDLIGRLIREAENQPNVSVVQRSAAQVKPWATDARLDAAGLLEATKGMRHARDAARHALFAAVHDGALPDPLSRKARA